jgi:succinate-semialdehyde dehydrogenase/glutarate-semialdehyde dehydrogenase
MAKMIIGGKKVDARGGATIDVINPANGTVVDTVPNAAAEDVDEAVAKAIAGQKVWGAVPLHERGRILRRFVEIALSKKEELASLLSRETGKPIREARAEIGNIPALFEGFVEKAKHLYGEAIPAGTEPGTEATLQITVREPVGVVACVIPFNFPVDLFGQKIAPALIAGDAAIVKPSTENPLTLIRLCELLIEAGVPDGAIEIVTGPGSTVGSRLCANPGIGVISLTGSTVVGIETMRAAAANLTPCALELGGNDAFIVLEDGDVDLAVEETIFGRTYNTGQVCCASKRFLIHNSVKAEFTEKIVARLKQLVQGDPADEKTTVGCLISEKAAKTVEEQVAKTVAQGAKIVAGGVRNGAFYAPTVLGDVTRTMDVAVDMEIFGPVIPIIGFDSDEEAVDIANASSFGLSGNVFSRNINRAMKVARAMECGGVVVNGCSFFRSCEMPFGGYKMSGIGNEGIACTLDEVTQVKTVVLKNVLR